MAESLKILQIAPGWSNSHILFNYRLAKTLASHGHNVTILTHVMNENIVPSNPPRGVNEHRFLPRLPLELKQRAVENLQELAFQKPSLSTYIQIAQTFSDLSVVTCEQLLSDDDLLDHLESTQFDLTLAHFFNLCPVGWSHRIGVQKFVWVAPGTFIVDYVTWVSSLPNLPSYLPNNFASSSDRMTFFDRVANTLWFFASLLTVTLRNSQLNQENVAFQSQSLGDEPDLWELAQRTRTTFINGEEFLDFPRPLLPGMIHLGELEHQSLKKLPQVH